MSTLSKIRLRYYTDEEIKTLAVVRVEHASTYDRGVPKTDGINDARMGLIDHTVRCPTCFKANCDQHFGYVELERPVYRLGSINTVLMVLRCVCRECAAPKWDTEPEPGEPSRDRLRLISEGLRNKLVCPSCKAPQPLYTRRARTFLDAVYRPKDLASDFVKSRGPEYIAFLKTRFMPDDAAAVLSAISRDTADVLGLDRPEAFMCRLQIVPPPIIRPSNFVGETKVRSENDLTSALQDIVRSNLELRATLETATSGPEYEHSYDKLQVMVSGVVNHTIKRAAAQAGLLPLVTATSKRKIIDIKGRLNGKKARVRGNLNGKRVDQSGRTVISGDASHDIDELGVPSAMMNKLTFPEMVTDLNRRDMEATVKRGAYVNNGALAVRPPSHALDHVIWLPILDREARVDLAAQLRPGWIVERHLRHGDWVLFNRQPSLWKASMMAFKCYRVSGLTVRLPLPVTRAFNADFDGDEMNIHALQSYEAVAEAQTLMGVAHQIVTPQSNSIIIGLVQDSLVGAWRLTAADTFFTYEDATELLFGSLQYSAPGRPEGSTDAYMDLATKAGFPLFDLGPPAILKSSRGPLWTGKQLVSALLPTTITLVANKTTGFSDLHTPAGLMVVRGQILAGRLNKTYLGAANTGLIHAIWRLYGPGGAHKFISDAQRLFVRHLAHHGPTQSIVDCLMDIDGSLSSAILSKHLSRSDAVLTLDLPAEVKEAKSTSILQETLRSVGAAVLDKVRTTSALANCVNSGSKGNVMNIAQIGGCVGQQTVYGRRVPLRATRLGPRTLMYYAPGDLRAEARGFVSNSYVSGLTPAEFFEHQMAGREGIVATAVNTSESGYNQRRMIKGQESQCIGYDGTVRVSSNIIIQSFYGGDDLDGSRLERIRLPWLFDSSIEWPDSALFREAHEVATRHATWRANLFRDMNLTFQCAVAVGPVLVPKLDRKPTSASTLDALGRGALLLHAQHHSAKKCSMNISVAALILQAFEHRIEESEIKTVLLMYSKALVAAGEGVGALGASSIGEPSMQMTLNVFHYSGIADKNVTITGLPRFKQLINGVDTYETANMTAELVSFEDAKNAQQISTVMLSDVISGTLGPTIGPPRLGFGTIKGPFAVKFAAAAKGDASSSSSSAGGLTAASFSLRLDWSKCALKNITSATVAKALRETFSYDAIVVAEPYWAGTQGPLIHVWLAPWIAPSGGQAILEGLLAHQQVRGIVSVKNAITFQQSHWAPTGTKTSRHVVETEGSNMVDLAKCSFVMAETITSTNVAEVARVVGISAGLTVLQAELHRVLSFDSSFIDPRHTALLADTMGRSGTLAAMNRHNMETLGSSLLQRASFEQSLDVFEEGAIHGREDPLAGATERIITGQPVCIGTGLMGIVTTTETTSKRAAEILVAPLGWASSSAAADFVAPLGSHGLLSGNQRVFDPSSFATRLTDMDRVASNSFFEACAAQFRSMAATKRLVPRMRITIQLTEGHYKAALSACAAYGQWTLSEPSALITEVTWPFGSSTGKTTLGSGAGPGKSHVIDMYAAESVQRYSCEIFGQRALEPIDVPFGVEASRVTMNQRVAFSKGPFTLTLARQWSANTNVEAEEALLKTKGATVAILDTSDPETILQNRCTDAQLGNALYVRIP